MGVCRGDSNHKPNYPHHAIPEVPWIIHITAVMVVGVNKGVDNTHDSMYVGSSLLVKTRFTWESQTVTEQTDSLAGLTNQTLNPKAVKGESKECVCC